MWSFLKFHPTEPESHTACSFPQGGLFSMAEPQVSIDIHNPSEFNFFCKSIRTKSHRNTRFHHLCKQAIQIAPQLNQNQLYHLRISLLSATSSPYKTSAKYAWLTLLQLPLTDEEQVLWELEKRYAVETRDDFRTMLKSVIDAPDQDFNDIQSDYFTATSKDGTSSTSTCTPTELDECTSTSTTNSEDFMAQDPVLWRSDFETPGGEGLNEKPDIGSTWPGAR